MLELQAHDPNTDSPWTKVAGMASRFIARQSRSKVLPLRNTPPIVTFTFDDVPASACELGASILEQHGARGTFYVAGRDCGTTSADGPRHASIDELRTVWTNGHEIGCHTFSHPAVRHITLDELGSEIRRNQTVLKAINSDIRVRNFAYPYGDLSVRTKRYLEDCFDSCRSGHAGINRGIADLGALDAWPLQNAVLDYAKTVELITETVRTRGWLIFYTHDVAEQPSSYGVSPDFLQRTVSAARDSGCVLATIADSLQLIRGRPSEE